MAGSDRGVGLIPEAGDEVLAAFERGDRRAPYVFGALWMARPCRRSPLESPRISRAVVTSWISAFASPSNWCVRNQRFACANGSTFNAPGVVVPASILAPIAPSLACR